MIGDIVSTRTIFERWMRNFPNEQAWLTYIKFEQRCGKLENARNLYERMIEQIPEQSVGACSLYHSRVTSSFPAGKSAKATRSTPAQSSSALSPSSQRRTWTRTCTTRHGY